MRHSWKSRIDFLDTLRLFLIIIVIYYHAAMLYSQPQSFVYHDNLAPDLLTRGILSMFLAVSQTYFMGLFFFISGFLTQIGRAHV
jgi:glucan biosynthesis protein C